MSMRERVVLLPGFLCDETLWTYQAKFLSKKYDVHVVDFKKATNLEEMISEIGKAIPGTTHLIGFSMGGHLAQVFTARFPENIKTLSLVAANVGALSPKMRDSRLKLAGMLKNANYKGMSHKELSKYLHPDSEAKPEVVETILKMSAGYNSQMYINQMMATIDREDMGQSIDDLSLPVLIVAGDCDKVVPKESLQEFHERIQNSQFHIIQNTGHYIPVEQPESLTSVLEDFLEEKR